MSVRQIMKAAELLVIVPDERKAAAVKATLEGEITPAVPASIIRTHPNAALYLDEPAASRLAKQTIASFATSESVRDPESGRWPRWQTYFAATSSYASIGGHAQIRLRSPYGLSIRATDGQNLWPRRYGSG